MLVLRKAYCLKLNLGLRWMHLGFRSGFSTYYLESYCTSGSLFPYLENE